MWYKRKTVHLEDSIHKKLKKRAFDKGISIEQELERILKEKFKPKKKKTKKR